MLMRRENWQETCPPYCTSDWIKQVTLGYYAARLYDVLSIIVCDQRFTRLTTWLDMLILIRCSCCQIQLRIYN
jgi:hypothetical protein